AGGRPRLSRRGAARAADDGVLAHVRARFRQLLVDAERAEYGARLRADADRHRDRGTAEHGVRDRLRARDRAEALPGQGTRERVLRPAARAVTGRTRARTLPALRQRRLVLRLLLESRRADPVRAAVDGARDGLRLAAVRRSGGRADAARDR